MNNVNLQKIVADDTKEADYDISDFDYDGDPKIKQDKDEKLDSPDEEIDTTEESWEEETEETPVEYDGDSEY